MNATFIQYQINEDDKLIYVNEAWQRSVIRDGYRELQADHILHRYLFDFITDSTTRMVYRDLLVRVRGGHAAKFSFRCDAPAQRRWMEMTIRRVERGVVEFSTHLLRKEDRLPMPLFDLTLPRSNTFLHLCSWCKQVKIKGNLWVEVEEAVADLHLFEHSLLPELSHGICPSCLVLLKKEGKGVKL